MSVLLRVNEIVERPVVTLQGDDVAQVRDVVFVDADGAIAGFTLAKRGLLGGRMKEVLPWGSVVGLGPDAVMVADEQALTREPLVTGTGGDDGEGDVLGDRVVTEGGADVGEVVDVVVEVDGATARVVGYEMKPSDTFVPAHGRRGRNLFVPRPDTLAASRQVVIVPDVIVEYVSDDLAGFGAAIEGFRARLREGGN